ncbi:STAS domain-containing protein [uncultured Tateyamaria sp.]|uniref:STAS domain-containing protein n=1 Tax=Tateyamaria sp. 1078 TaxID=3417464 RepID=UPI002613BD81|nr:STAS domain-containing protein [uncultured Tateyamaria sp.]
MAERVVLVDRLDTAAAAALASELMQKPADGHVTLDGGAVTHFGAQAVQVIVSAAKTWSASGGTLECTDISARAATHLAAMGLTFAELTEVSQ